VRLDIDAALTKRSLGWLLIGAAATATAATVGADLLGAGLESGFGPAQRAALLAALLTAAFGASLVPLGRRQSPLATRTSPLARAQREAQPDSESASSAMAALRWVARALLAVTVIAYIGYALIYFNYAAALFRFPFDYDQGEGFELNDTILFARGEWPYRDNEVYPFYASNYPPLFHLMAVPLVWLFGPEYWTGRLLSFGATLATAGAIGGAVWRETGRRWIALLSGLAFLASNYVYHIGPLFRQHMTMVMFETLAIVALSSTTETTNKRIDRKSPEAASPNRQYLAPLVFLLLAGYTKQLAISTVAAAFVFLFLRNPRRAVVLGMAFAAIAGGIFLAIDRATGGQWWLNIILANVNEFELPRAIALYRQWLGLHLLLAAGAAAWLMYETYWSRLSAYSLWFAFAVANAALSGKWGAGESYFTTAVAAACLVSGIALGQVANASWAASGLRAMAVACLVPAFYLVQAARPVHLPTEGPVFGPLARGLGVPLDSAYYDSQGYTQLGRPPTAADIDAGERILEYVRSVPGPALTEEAAFPIRAGKPVVTNPTQLLNLYKNKLYDPTTLMDMIGNKEFGVVVLRAQFYPVPVLGAIGESYAPAEEVMMNGFTYRVLLPRQ
jgi:hypothetical protein